MDIRCCCDAGRVLGSVELPRDVLVGEHITFPLLAATQWGVAAGVPSPDRASVTLEVGTVYLYTCDDFAGRVVALKSRDLPVELLRRIPTFIEAT